MPVFKAEQEEVTRDLDIPPAVFGQFFHFSLPEPFHRLEPLGGFPLFQRLRGKMVQAQPEAQSPENILQYVKRGKRLKVPCRVGPQDLVVEFFYVEPDYQIRLFEMVDKRFRLVFLKGVKPILKGVEYDGDGYAHQV